MELGELILLEKFNRDENKRYYGKYLCFCGKEFVTTLDKIKSGHTKSCGCYSKFLAQQRQATHGETKTKLYKIHEAIKYRTQSPNSSDYHRYGGRGINLCTEWFKYENFRDWALNNDYKDGLSIDRIDNDKGYSPHNCRWATKKQQAQNRNKKCTSKSNYKGVRYVYSATTGKHWLSRITVNGVRYLDRFYSEIEAAINYNNLAIKYFGEFVCLNKINLPTL